MNIQQVRFPCGFGVRLISDVVCKSLSFKEHRWSARKQVQSGSNGLCSRLSTYLHSPNHRGMHSFTG